MSSGALLQLGFLGLLAASIPLLWVWVKGDADKYRKLVWITTFVTFDLIVFGAFTRLTDSGLGCFVRPVDGDRRISHSGGQPKVSTFLTISPGQKTAVAVMCNLRNAKVQPLANALMKLVAK